MHSKLSLSLRPHLFNFLHRDVLLNALTCASIVPFIHVWIPVWTIVKLLIKYLASNRIYWIVNILILKCDGVSSVSVIDQLARWRVAEARTNSLVVWCATSCARALRWILVLLHPLVLLMDEILLVRGTACVVGVTNCIEDLWLALLALDVDVVWCVDCLQILKVAFLVWVWIVILIVDLAKLLIPVASFWWLCPTLWVICHKDILFVGLAHELAIDSRGWHDLLRGLGSSDIWILHKSLVCVIDPTDGVVTASELVGILNHHLLLVHVIILIQSLICWWTHANLLKVWILVDILQLCRIRLLYRVGGWTIRKWKWRTLIFDMWNALSAGLHQIWPSWL